MKSLNIIADELNEGKRMLKKLIMNKNCFLMMCAPFVFQMPGIMIEFNLIAKLQCWMMTMEMHNKCSFVMFHIKAASNIKLLN